MYYIYGISGPSLLIESTDSMIIMLISDLDECALGLDDCDENADCSNSDGGFNCSCKRNYFGDGKLCFS